MHRTRLILGTLSGLSYDTEAQIRLFKRLGFDGFFTNWSCDHDTAAYRALADELGMIYQSIHAPFGKMRHMWYPDEKTEDAIAELCECLGACAAYGVPIMIVHAFIGFKDHTPTAIGIENYRRVVKEAERLGVKIAFENTEGEEYLAALMDAFRDSPAVGFCWDTGHEMCYNHSKDMLSLYGGRLIATHINDNLGIRDFEGEMTYFDDFHLLPFDGVGAWENVAARLKRHGFTETLTFELNRHPREYDIYAGMTDEEYLTHAFLRAARVAALCHR